MKVEVSDLQPNKKIYFASDFHLGAPSWEKSLEREKKIVRWLDSISHDAQQIFLVGDLFDFWFEYKHVVPKGFVRFLGKLANLADQGVEIVIFCGNHDLWFRDYLEKEMSAKIYSKPVSIKLAEKLFYISHGDGLGPGQTKFQILKWIFTNRFCQWMFHWLHPNIGIGLAKFWSGSSRHRNSAQSTDDQRLIEYSQNIEKTSHHDYYIYGDCHLDKLVNIKENATYINLGEWLDKSSYAVFDGIEVSLKTFDD